ncbi:MAG: hypothetical protein V1829_00035 [bacterium]
MDIKLMPKEYDSKSKSSAGAKSSARGFASLGGKIVSKSSLWITLIVGLSVIIVLISLGMFGYKTILNKEKRELTSQIENLQSQRDLELEASFIGLKNRIDDLKDLLKKRVYSSNAFDMLEELTLPQIQLSDFDMDLSQNKISVGVEAVDYQTLAKQAVVFEQDSRIKKTEISSIDLDVSGRVTSGFIIELNPNIFNYVAE